ncbi:spore germination protein KB [Paenibacillus sp. UNCCL117]|uniref:GerAB/ArcD/ProY family transporter n=1 Tax=unclassified Paenibacillus TaxID=185978 RepID=UPI000885B45E|nr:MULTISPECIES: endospore germination permease [unclassified Paenibacillus]SDD39270.1 spore germination protein KB [Paenibacillus sp. cl123]SFW48404.1 spore germination protein KB [Paenibacillus sp. UNCCL117]
MVEQGKISIRQFKILVMLFSLGSAILIVPSSLTSASRQDAWISAILGGGMGLLLLLMYNHLAKRHPEKSLVEYSEAILGKWLGKAVGLLFVSFFFLLSSLVLRNIGDFITTIVMPETPIQAIHIMFTLIVIAGVRLGLEVIARASEVFTPWVLFLIFVLVAVIAPEMKLDRIEPVLEAGFKPLIRGGLSILGIPYLELVVFLMVLPYVNKKEKAGKAFIAGAMFGGAILVALTALCVLVLGWDFTSRHAFPSYTLAKKIHIGEFLQRIEVLMAVIWFLTIFFKLVICFYASALGLAQILKIQSARILLLPLGMSMTVLSLVAYPNIVYFRAFASEVWFSYALTFGLLLPLLLIGADMIRRAISK